MVLGTLLIVICLIFAPILFGLIGIGIIYYAKCIEWIGLKILYIWSSMWKYTWSKVYENLFKN